MRKKYKLKKEFKKLLILFLGMALATQLVGNSVVFAMNDSNDVIATYEVGVEGNNVIATLTKDGTMTLSGVGDTKDYTSDTMPFQDNISNIKDIVIEEGVTSIGNAMFYNCKDINGKLIIPSTVVEIGDYAFAGDSYESAPKITKIENSFTQSNIVVETPVEKKVDDSATEKSTEEQETSAEGEPATDTASQDDTTKQEEQPVQETVKTVKSITEQQIGKNIFVQGQNGGYSSAETNKSFINAVKEAGYVRADRFVLVKMDDSITQEVPVIEGQLVLPSKPDTLGVLAEDALTAYQFAGWKIEGSDKVLSPKDNYSISDDAEELNLTSQWQQTWKINPKVKTEAKEEVSIYSVIDSNTGKVLENVNGYIITVQWQINKKDKEDENSWENVENATSFTYERKTEAGDTDNYFRAKLSITKQSKLRNLPETEVMTTDVVKGVNTTNSITVTYDSNGGFGTIENNEIKDGENYKLEECIYTRSDEKTFIGWKVSSNGVTIKNSKEQVINNDAVLLSSDSIYVTAVTDNPSITFVAQWGEMTSVYVDSSKLSSGDGSSPDAAVRTLDEAYDKLSSSGTIDSNIIYIVNDYTFNKGTISLGNKAATITSLNKENISNLRGDLSDLNEDSNNFIKCTADTKFEYIGLLFGSQLNYARPTGIYGYGHTLIMGKEVTTDGNLRVFGGTRYADETVESTNLIIYSGSYSMVAGGGYYGSVTKDTSIILYGGEIQQTIYAGRGSVSANWETNGTIYGSAFVTIYDVQFMTKGFGVQPTRAGTILGDGHDYAYIARIYGGKISNVFGEVHSPWVGKQGKKSLIEVYGGEIVGGVYGGSTDSNMYNGDYALKDGVDINIYGGKIGEVYGGGNDTYYNTAYQAMSGTRTIHILGGEISNNVFGGANLGSVDGDSIIVIENAVVKGSIYGGGNGDNNKRASIKGSTNIRIGTNAVIEGNVFGAGNNNSEITKNILIKVEDTANVKNIYGGGNGAKTTVTGLVNIEVNGGNIENIYGGGELGSSDKTYINIAQGTIMGSVYGGGNKIGVNQSNITVTNNPNINGNVYGGSNASGTTTESIVNIKGKVNANVYGGGNGAETTVTTSTVNIESAANITGNIFGGGELGVVETSNVNLNGGTIAGKVFGGGNNVGVTTSNVNVNGTTNLTQNDSAIFGGSNAKGTTNNSNVIIGCYGIEKNIYGGGLGSETTVEKSVVNFTENADISGQVYGGGKEGKVTDTEIKLASGANASDIFGGGHFVGVDSSVKITSEKGSFASNIYGGSNENGIVKNPLVTIEGGVGNVYGAGKGSGTTTENPSVTLTGGDTVVSNAVYGGGEKGVSTGLAKVTLQNGANNIENIYGAGNDAGVDGNTEVNISNDSTANFVYGGSNNTGEVTGKATVIISGVAICDVFGGGKGANTIVNNSYVESSSTSRIEGNVFGGSDQGIITTNTEMQIDGTILGSIYGAGKGVSSNVMGNTHVVLFGATVSKDVFGGGSQGGIAGNSHVDLLSGTVTGSAFGGSDQALVQGDSKVHMGINAATNQKTPDVMKMIVKDSIFGGGNTTNSGKAFDASNPFVLGNSEVLIDQDGYDYANFSIGKNILGDGNMCVTAGNKNISIKNYRDRNTIKTLSSIQRATTLTLDRTWIELTGAMDSANLLPTMEYSLSRIDTLRLDGNVALNLYKEVNLVRALESCVNGVPMDEWTVKDADGNAITLQQGIGFELRTNEDVSRPGYGTVVGYTLLKRYDKENKDLTDGVYVLGGYDEANTNYGFVAGEDVFEKLGDTTPTIKKGEKLTPETDSKSWNNWRLGRRVDTKTFNLYASDRPSSGKTKAVESSWAADGSIYRLDKDSVKITNQNGNTEAFNFVDPETLMSEVDKNTFGLEISTGQNGWLEQGNIGYVKGSTKADSKNELVLNDTGEMVAINNSEVFPLINVTLSNLNDITTKDDNTPVTVSFDISTYTKQADGTEMKTGTMTINVNIFRNNFETYADTTVEAGKNYKGATQVYTYGQDHKVALTISKASSITLQFARKESAGTAVPTNHDLDFSKPLPIGTKITMIDKSANDAKYYHYEAITDVSKIALSDFIANDSTNSQYTPITAGNSAENYIFIIDFAGAPTFEGDAIDVGLSAYNNTQLIKKQNIVFSVSGNQRIYTLSSLKDDEKTFTRYSIGSTVSIDLSTAVDVKTGSIDTTGRDKQMGAKVRLYSVDNDSYINIPSTWEVISQGTHYAAGGNNFTINLADGLTVTNSNIYIQMSSIGNLPIGKYRLDIDLISGALANYPEDDNALAKNTIKIGIELTDYSYSIKSTMADKNRQLFSNTDTNKEVEINLEKATSSGVSTSGIYVQQTLYKKNEDNGTYESVNLDVLFDPSRLPLVNNKLAWDKNVLNYKYKDNIPAGTYRLQFDVMQADAFNDLAKAKDIVRATDTINIVVTDD